MDCASPSSRQKSNPGDRQAPDDNGIALFPATARALRVEQLSFTWLALHRVNFHHQNCPLVSSDVGLRRRGSSVRRNSEESRTTTVRKWVPLLSQWLEGIAHNQIPDTATNIESCSTLLAVLIVQADGFWIGFVYSVEMPRRSVLSRKSRSLTEKLPPQIRDLPREFTHPGGLAAGALRN